MNTHENTPTPNDAETLIANLRQSGFIGTADGIERYLAMDKPQEGPPNAVPCNSSHFNAENVSAEVRPPNRKETLSSEQARYAYDAALKPLLPEWAQRGLDCDPMITRRECVEVEPERQPTPEENWDYWFSVPRAVMMGEVNSLGQVRYHGPKSARWIKSDGSPMFPRTSTPLT